MYVYMHAPGLSSPPSPEQRRARQAAGMTASFVRFGTRRHGCVTTFCHDREQEGLLKHRSSMGKTLLLAVGLGTTFCSVFV